MTKKTNKIKPASATANPTIPLLGKKDFSKKIGPKTMKGATTTAESSCQRATRFCLRFRSFDCSMKGCRGFIILAVVRLPKFRTSIP